MAKTWVLLDCDGVLLDWDQGIQSYAVSEHPHVWNGDHMDEHSYDIAGRMNISPDQAQQLIWDFHHSDAYAHVPAMPSAPAAVAQLHKFFHLVIITACGTDATTVKLRKQNLLDVFGDVFMHIHCTDGFEEKAHYLRSYDPGYWVEDHVKNADMGALYGHQSFLIDAPHNSHVSPRWAQRVSSLSEAASIMLDTLHATLRRSHRN